MDKESMVCVECCGTCKHYVQYIGDEDFCHRLKNKLGENWKQEDNQVEPYQKCKYYESSERMFNYLLTKLDIKK